MAFYCNCGNDNIRDRAGWIQALRGQIVVVYFLASLWKLNADWLNGDIVKETFLSFEEQGTNRGVPWNALYNEFPRIFEFVGVSGLLLDFSLFVVLMFLPPGHTLQSLGLLFHEFTGYTMSQRIGYSFPLAMIFAGLLFQPMDVIEQDQAEVGWDKLSHFRWLLLHTNTKRRSDSPPTGRQRRRHVYVWPLLYLLVKWLIPLRMPIVSHGEFKHTFEGYRWSWTMMLHSKSNMASPGLSFMTLTPECENISQPYPNPLAADMAFLDVHSVPYERSLSTRIRTASLAQMFPRQMPKIAHNVDKH
jgi:hypothetical protein